MITEMRDIPTPGGSDHLLWRTGSGGTVEIYDIAVMSERRKGVGRGMVAELLRSLPPTTIVFAITRADNEIAQQFYEALGFRTVNVLRRFYGADKGVDALMYLRKAGEPI